MKTITSSIVFAIFFFLNQYETKAQPDYNLRFELVSADGSDYVVDLIMSFSTAGGLGTSNLVFTYNGDDISAPVLVSHNLNGNYSEPTVTTPGSNTASFNIELNVINNGIAVGVEPAETNLARISFTIDDPGGNSDLQWQSTNPVHVVFLDNENDILDADNLEPLNTSPLPLELIYFNAVTEDQSVLLNWKSVNEINFDRFEIERSVNGTAFTKIGEQGGRGGEWQQAYFMKDIDVKTGVEYYYRLRQIDKDGRFDFSNTVSAKLLYIEDPISVYPNPNNGSFLIKSHESDNQDLELEIINNQGQVVWGTKLSEKEIKVNQLSKGVYIVRLSGDKNSWIQKLVIH